MTQQENTQEMNEHERPTIVPPPGPRSTPASSSETTKTSKPRGFAAMDRNLVRSIAKKGGIAAHEAGTAHEFTTEEARTAGQKGGRATHARRGKGQQGV